jgi:selenocysteine lyase/cysteine desulfurase
MTLSRRFLDQTAEIDGLQVFGPKDTADRVAVFSIRLRGYEPAELAALMESEFGILSRSGIMCAPLAHETLGTLADGGTTRLSFGALNSVADVDRSVEALSQLAESGAAV